MKAYLLPDATVPEKRLARRLGGAGASSWKTFPNGEEFVRVERPANRAVVIGRSAPPAAGLFRTLLLIDTLRRSGVKDITLALPYYGYARQDRAVRLGDPVTALFVARQAAAAGARRVVTLDLHSRRVAEGGDVPVLSSSVLPTIADRLKGRVRGPLTVVSPDRGGKERAERFAARFGRRAKTAWVEKTRDITGRVTARDVLGTLAGDTAVIVDDIVDTGKTVALAVGLLRAKGFRRLYLCAAHPVLSDDAIRRLRTCRFTGILFSDTLPLTATARRTLTPAVLRADAALAKAIRASNR